MFTWSMVKQKLKNTVFPNVSIFPKELYEYRPFNIMYTAIALY